MQQPPECNFQLLQNNAGYFKQCALELFQYQSKNCKIYKDYIQTLGKWNTDLVQFEDIPYLPIAFFKSHDVVCGTNKPSFYFTSSSTTGQIPSKHFIPDIEAYKKHCKLQFEAIYGNINQYEFYGLLPSYLERSGSGLIHMVDYFMEASGQHQKHYYLYDFGALITHLKSPNSRKKVLFGVSFALIDCATQFPVNLSDVIVIETGGMKGRKEEWVRAQVHDYLKAHWSLQNIHSEYGMTELQSQAYAIQNGEFTCSASMHYTLRNTTDPFDYGPHIQRGAINIIDLANTDSCAFIETADLGLRINERTFSVLGRLDTAEVRGCSLLYTG